VDGGQFRSVTRFYDAKTGSSILKKILAAAAIVGLAGLTACAPSTPAPAGTSASTTTTSSVAGTPKATPATSSGTAAAAGGVKDACELFNTLYADYKAAVPQNDPNAYEDIYLKSEEAKKKAPRDVASLFAALSLLAIDHSAAAESGGGPEQASKDAVRDAVFGNAGSACTAEDVTLRL
jgi:hypothetical protein